MSSLSVNAAAEAFFAHLPIEKLSDKENELLKLLQGITVVINELLPRSVGLQLWAERRLHPDLAETVNGSGIVFIQPSSKEDDQSCADVVGGTVVERTRKTPCFRYWASVVSCLRVDGAIRIRACSRVFLETVAMPSVQQELWMSEGIRWSLVETPHLIPTRLQALSKWRRLSLLGEIQSDSSPGSRSNKFITFNNIEEWHLVVMELERLIEDEREFSHFALCWMYFPVIELQRLTIAVKLRQAEIVKEIVDRLGPRGRNIFVIPFPYSDASWDLGSSVCVELMFHLYDCGGSPIDFPNHPDLERYCFQQTFLLDVPQGQRAFCYADEYDADPFEFSIDEAKHTHLLTDLSDSRPQFLSWLEHLICKSRDEYACVKFLSAAACHSEYPPEYCDGSS